MAGVWTPARTVYEEYWQRPGRTPRGARHDVRVAETFRADLAFVVRLAGLRSDTGDRAANGRSRLDLSDGQRQDTGDAAREPSCSSETREFELHARWPRLLLCPAVQPSSPAIASSLSLGLCAGAILAMAHTRTQPAGTEPVADDRHDAAASACPESRVAGERAHALAWRALRTRRRGRAKASDDAARGALPRRAVAHRASHRSGSATRRAGHGESGRWVRPLRCAVC